MSRPRIVDQHQLFSNLVVVVCISWSEVRPDFIVEPSLTSQPTTTTTRVRRLAIFSPTASAVADNHLRSNLNCDSNRSAATMTNSTCLQPDPIVFDSTRWQSDPVWCSATRPESTRICIFSTDPTQFHSLQASG